MGNVLLDKRDERRETGARVIPAGKLNHNAQRTAPWLRPVLIMSAHRRRGQGEPRKDWEFALAMKELLRSNDPVLLSYVSALLTEEDIDFIVADANMSVLEGSIGALPRR
ncbi:MAG TPA: DUF2007 domain-containing protein, partial [Methyloceanibacter sp.]|nr:DUF2007 domain-containing protein [Methyloceanibacter sp.]